MVESLGLLRFGNLIFGHRAIKIFANRNQRALQNFLFDIAQSHDMSTGGKDMRDAVPHRARADNSYILNAHRHAPVKAESNTASGLARFDGCLRLSNREGLASRNFTLAPVFLHFVTRSQMLVWSTTMNIHMTAKVKTALMAFAFLAASAGMAAAQDYGYHDRDRDDYYGHNRYDRDDFGRGQQVARSIGFEDGEQQAREDMWRAKPFNPYPRGRNHADRGYARDFGSVREYREQYAQAYQQGYSRAFHRDRFYR